MLIDHGLELLTEDECWRLLSGAAVGRVGISADGVPLIVPVNYLVVDRTIVFRTAPGRKLAAAEAHQVVAFEVDDVGPYDRSGWSVLLVGRADVVSAADVDAARLVPHADGPREALVRIAPVSVSGRRLVHGAAALDGTV